MSSKINKIKENVEANKRLKAYTLYGSLIGSVIVTIGKLVKKTEDDMIKDFARFSKDEELAKSKNILAGPEVASRGFINMKENYEIYEGIVDAFNRVSEKMLASRFVNWNDYKKEIKDETSRFLYKELQRSPVIIPIIIATDEE